MVGGVTPPPTRNTPPPTPPPSPGPTPGPLPSPTPRPWPVPIPPPAPGPVEGGPGTPFGSPRFSKLIRGICASCGATTVGSMTNVGSGFFDGSGVSDVPDRLAIGGETEFLGSLAKLLSTCREVGFVGV